MISKDTIESHSSGYKHPGNPLRLYGLYMGEIANREDPEKLGRCQVRVYEVHDNLPDEDLPWAWPKFIGAGHAKSGSFYVPPNKTTVYAEFLMGDPDHPVWSGGFWGKPNGETEIPSKMHDSEGMPDNHVFETPGGHYVELDDRDGVQKVRIKTASGHEIILDETEESTEKSDEENPDAITYKQKGIHIFTSGEQEFHMIDEADREGQHTGIFAKTKAGHSLRLKDSEDSDGKIKGIRLEDAKGNFIQMDNTNDLLELEWTGDAKCNIVGNLEVSVGGFWKNSIGSLFKAVSATLNLINSSTTAAVENWVWSGSTHTRNGATKDTGPNSHG